MPDAPLPSPARRLAPVVLAMALLGGCFTGERPSFEEREAVGDPVIAAVLARLDRAEATAFTAHYDIIPSRTGATTKAVVRRLPDGSQRISIGDVLYTTDGTKSRTCVDDDSGCVDGIDDARISDLNITHRFWGPSFADRLRLDASRSIADGVAREVAIAGQPATCADVTVVGGTVTYCALDAGVLARYFGADVSIELTFFSASAQEGAG